MSELCSHCQRVIHVNAKKYCCYQCREEWKCCSKCVKSSLHRHSLHKDLVLNPITISADSCSQLIVNAFDKFSHRKFIGIRDREVQRNLVEVDRLSVPYTWNTYANLKCLTNGAIQMITSHSRSAILIIGVLSLRYIAVLLASILANIVVVPLVKFSFSLSLSRSLSLSSILYSVFRDFR